MVRERKGREDRRKRRIRMEVVMGETQQGGCLLSLKDDGQRESARGREEGREGGRERWADGDEDAIYLKNRLLRCH